MNSVGLAAEDRLAPLRRACLDVIGGAGAQLHWCASGTVALAAVLRAIARLPHRRRRRRVAIPAAVCQQVYLAVLASGLEPVLVASTIASGEYRMDLDALEPVPDIAAVVWVHQYGAISGAADARALCRRHDWVLVEDAALAFGAAVPEGRAGSLGDCAILSFGRGKVIDVDYGGAAVVNAGPFADALRPLLQAECAAANAAGRDAHDALDAFDRMFKRVYNTDYEALRAGARIGALAPALETCVAHQPALSEARLVSVLGAAAISDAPARAAARVNRAAWWQTMLRSAPVQDVVIHRGGTYWRLNVRVDAAVRHRVLRAAIAAGLPISSWQPPLYWLVSGLAVTGDTRSELAFADQVLNLWVDDVDDWPRYADSLLALLQAAS